MVARWIPLIDQVDDWVALCREVGVVIHFRPNMSKPYLLVVGKAPPLFLIPDWPMADARQAMVCLLWLRYAFMSRGRDELLVKMRELIERGQAANADDQAAG